MFHWNPDPIAFKLGPLAVHWYGICWAASFLFAEFAARRRLVAMGHAHVDVAAMTLLALAGTIVGARLGHTLFYDPAYYFSHPLKFLAVWEGGLASHGGAVGLVLGLAWGARRYARGVPVLTLTDVVAIPSAIGGALIRIANFINSEIVGVPTQAAWGVVFDRIDAQPRHPVQLYEAGAYLLIAAALWLYQRRSNPWPSPGRMTGLFFIAVFVARAVLEIWKTPQAVYEAGMAVTVGQWLSVPFILFGVFLFIRSRR